MGLLDSLKNIFSTPQTAKVNSDDTPVTGFPALVESMFAQQQHKGRYHSIKAKDYPEYEQILNFSSPDKVRFLLYALKTVSENAAKMGSTYHYNPADKNFFAIMILQDIYLSSNAEIKDTNE